jgi:predicted nucleotidyltransferase
METTKNQLSSFEKVFFEQLRNYVDKPIYFYGSIQRNDYFPKLSDIDIDIFTDNEMSTLNALQNYLNLNKNKFNKIMYKMDKTNKVIRGYKCKYVDEIHNLSVEISLYNEKDKEEILTTHQNKIILPFYVTTLLIILKFLYYNLQIVPTEFFKKCKEMLLVKSNSKTQFISLDNINY